MKLLLDTRGRTLIDDPENFLFSATSVWEVLIKCGLGREDFKADARRLRRCLLDNGHSELPLVGVGED